MNNKLEAVISQFEIHNILFGNVLEGTEENNAHSLNEFTNHISWIAGHLVSSRYMIANLLGLQLEEPYVGLFEHGKGIDRKAEYPTISKQINAWNEITPQLIEKLKSTPDETLDNKGPFKVPTGETIGQIINFFAHHEAYHLGQLGILRKYFGKEAMKYNYKKRAI
jgi:uncharacterized damage-inducible protein DinB